MTIQELYATIGGNYEGVKRILPMDKLIEKFIIRLLDEKSYARLMAACEANDEKELFEASHALKGVLANLGLDDLSAKASVISEEYRPGKSRTMSDDDVRARIKEFSEQFSAAIEAIKTFAGR